MTGRLRYLTHLGLTTRPPHPAPTADDFDREYYDPAPANPLRKSGYREYTEAEHHDALWGLAAVIDEVFHPRTALDVGCAKGFLVRALTLRGIDAAGADHSEYAIQEADGAVKDRVCCAPVVSLPEEWGEAFDLVVSVEMLEHLPEDDVRWALQEIRRVARRYVLLTINVFPDSYQGAEPVAWDPHDVTHRTMARRAWWDRQLAAAGFGLAPMLEKEVREHRNVTRVGWQCFVRRAH